MENCRELRTAVGTTRAAGDGAPSQTTYHITRTHPLSVASSLLPFFLDPIKALSHPLEKHWGNSTSQWCPTTNMKTVAIILALAVITGCNGRAVRQQVATPTQWEAAVNRFWQYISDLNVQADGVLQNLKASQLSRELDTLISDSMAELTAYSENLQTKLSEQTSSTQLAQDMQLLANKLQKDMLDAKDRTTSYLGELTTMVELNTDDVRDRVGTYATKLKKRLDKDTEQIRNTVAAYAEELQSRTSQNLDAARQHVEPYVNQASDSANKKMVDISTSLQTQVEVLGKELMTQTDVFKTQLEATAEELRVSLEGKIDELKELFAPMATQIREQFETIIDKATETASL